MNLHDWLSIIARPRHSIFRCGSVAGGSRGPIGEGLNARSELMPCVWPMQAIVDVTALHCPYTPAWAWRTLFFKSLI
jgi:hypothetical protein